MSLATTAALSILRRRELAAAAWALVKDGMVAANDATTAAMKATGALEANARVNESANSPDVAARARAYQRAKADAEGTKEAADLAFGLYLATVGGADLQARLDAKEASDDAEQKARDAKAKADAAFADTSSQTKADLALEAAVEAADLWVDAAAEAAKATADAERYARAYAARIRELRA